MIPVQFTCENCGQPVPFMDAGLRRYEHRNHCPYCQWSKHILFGTPRLHPCDALMKPSPTTSLFINQDCDGCGFRWVTYDEDWWATLDPETQTEVMNAAWTETGQQNEKPLAIYIVRPEYRTPPPRIPPAFLGTRTRVKRRP